MFHFLLKETLDFEPPEVLGTYSLKSLLQGDVYSLRGKEKPLECS
jgi:hypothetical protein